MKHHPQITALLLVIFLLAQFLGLAILYQYIDRPKSLEEGKTVFKALPIGERPPVDEQTSFIPVIIAILLGTGLLFVLMKYNLHLLWKLWFLLAVIISLTVALSAFIPTPLAAGIAILAGIWKIFRPNVWIQNLTELFIYGGLAAIFSPLFTLLSVSILLILIAAYDAYAVWKSKHMIVLAQSQTKEKVFAGLLIPYKTIPSAEIPKTKVPLAPLSERTAILGGGDIGFPLIFAGVVLKEMGLWQSLFIPVFAFAGLALLLFYADEKKFYPAMPFIGAGCFIGLGVVWVVGMFG